MVDAAKPSAAEAKPAPPPPAASGPGPSDDFQKEVQKKKAVAAPSGGASDPDKAEPKASGGASEPGKAEPKASGGASEPGKAGPKASGGASDPGKAGPKASGGASDPGKAEPKASGGASEPGKAEEPAPSGGSGAVPEPNDLSAVPGASGGASAASGDSLIPQLEPLSDGTGGGASGASDSGEFPELTALLNPSGAISNASGGDEILASGGALEPNDLSIVPGASGGASNASGDSLIPQLETLSEGTGGGASGASDSGGFPELTALLNPSGGSVIAEANDLKTPASGGAETAASGDATSASGEATNASGDATSASGEATDASGGAKLSPADQAFRDAIQRGDAAAVNGFLNGNATYDINAVDPERGQTALHLATRSDKLDIVNALIAKGANVNIQDTVSKATPLHLAAMSSKEVVEALIKAGADMTLKNDVGETAFRNATYWGNPRGSNGQYPGDSIAKENANILAKEAYNRVQDYFQAGDWTKAVDFIKAGTGVDAGARYTHAGEDNVSLLSYAAGAGQLDMVKALVEATPKDKREDTINTKGSRGRTALHSAADTGTQEIYDYLRSQGGDRAIRADDGTTPIGIDFEKRSATMSHEERIKAYEEAGYRIWDQPKFNTQWSQLRFITHSQHDAENGIILLKMHDGSLGYDDIVGGDFTKNPFLSWDDQGHPKGHYILVSRERSLKAYEVIRKYISGKMEEMPGPSDWNGNEHSDFALTTFYMDPRYKDYYPTNDMDIATPEGVFWKLG